MMTPAQITEQNAIEAKLNAGLGNTLTERENLILLYSDFHKDAYGFRPRTVNVYAKTTEELKADYARFEAVCRENEEAEAIAQAEADNVFKTLIANTIQMGAEDEVTALRWIAEGAIEEYGYDYEHFIWSQGILFSAYGKEMAKKLAPIFGQVYADRRVA
jgi:hypothetical protein